MNTVQEAVNIIALYKKALLALLQTRSKSITEVKILVHLQLKNGRVYPVELTNFVNLEAKLETHWGLGDFHIECKDSKKNYEQIVSSFKLYQMPHCCGICVSTASNVYDPFRKLGIATLLNKFRQDIAGHMGYTILLCTDCDNNIAQRKVLENNGWKDIYQFINRRTKNVLNISVKHL